MLSLTILLLGAAISLLPNSVKAIDTDLQNVHFFTQQSEPTRVMRSENIVYGAQLYAEVGTDRFIIEHQEWADQLFKEIILQSDLDQDGFMEILLSVETGSGCCGADLYIVSHREDGFFSVQTSKYFKNFSDVTIITKEGRKLIKVKQDDAKIGGTSWNQAIGIFIFKDGQLHKLSHSKNLAKTAPLIEFTSAYLQAFPEESGERRLQIDDDNWLDKVSCKLSYIERFLDCNVTLSGGAIFKSPKNCKRFAVLETSNYGVKDLGCNRTRTGRFDGELYEWSP